MKKLVKLTIEDIEKVVHKVIQEQMEQQENGTPYILAKGDDGYMYVMNPETGEIIGRKPL